jgi:hypothetical protein
MNGFNGTSVTITVNYNSSHIELLLNDVCLMNLSEESLEFPNELPFITATRLEYKSTCQTVNCLYYSVCCHGNVFVNIGCRGNRC